MQRSKLELKKGSILRKELLDDLYNYPRIAVNTYFSRFSDGILYGLEWKEDKENIGKHIITPGALKYHGEIYFLSESIYVEEILKEQIQIDKKYRLCFEKIEGYKTVDTQTIYELRLRAVQSEEYQRIKDKSFYYARVRCNENSILETFYDGEVYGLYAAEDGFEYRLPNWITKQVLSLTIEEKENKHPLDYLLLKEIYEGKGLSVSLSCMYLKECGIQVKEADFVVPNILVEKLKLAIDDLKVKSVIKYFEETSCKEINVECQNGGLLL